MHTEFAQRTSFVSQRFDACAARSRRAAGSRKVQAS
jgi:hypothetical protein